MKNTKKDEKMSETEVSENKNCMKFDTEFLKRYLKTCMYVSYWEIRKRYQLLWVTKSKKNEITQECKRTILDQRRSHLYTQAHTHHKVIEQKEQKWAMYHRRWLWHIKIISIVTPCVTFLTTFWILISAYSNRSIQKQ
jgi:hypothetical protein